MKAGIAFGSNMGERAKNLRRAREKILRLPQVREPFLCSSVYETAPVGCEPGAQKFLNAVMEIDWEGEPHALLRELRTIEVSLGRACDHARNVSRTIDLDLLYFGERRLNAPELRLPHPRLHERRFVLAPLAEIRPEFILPGQTESVQTLLHELPDDSAVVRVAGEW